MNSHTPNHFYPTARMKVRIGIVICLFSMLFRASGPGVEAGFPSQTSTPAFSIVMPFVNFIYLPVIASGSQPIYNGDFELGPDPSGNPIGWTAYSGGEEGLAYSLVVKNPTFGEQTDLYIPMGSYSILLGSPDYTCENGVPIGVAAINQTIRVPNVPDYMPLNLVFDYIIWTQDRSSDVQYDRFEVIITEGNVDNLAYADGNYAKDESCDPKHISRIPPLPPSPNAWKLGTVDLKSPIDFRGKTVTISFQNWNRFDHWYNTVTYIDSVQFNTEPLN
jgi:hypothetical protein